MKPTARPRRTTVVECALALPAIVSFCMALLGTIAAAGGYVLATPGDLDLAEIRSVLEAM